MPEAHREAYRVPPRSDGGVAWRCGTFWRRAAEGVPLAYQGVPDG